MRWVAVLLGAFAAASPGSASGSEGESSLSVSLGYATYVVPDYQPSGGVLGIDYERGFSDALSFRISGGAGGYYGGGAETYSGHLVVGITYLFDVIKYVPYANLGVGAIYITGADGLADDPGSTEARLSGLVELGVGLDVLHSRSFSYGVAVRFETFVQQTSFFTGGLRATYRWGFF